MATTGFHPASQAYTTPPNSHGVHSIQNGLQQISPSDSTTNTPMNQSPISPHNSSNFSALPLTGRQLRPPKSPMYVPAALRPTERPVRASPLTPPRSLHSSTDSLDRVGESRPVSRRSTTSIQKKGPLGQVAEDEAVLEDDESFPPIEGMPTRQHWKPDANASVCDAPTCQKSFNLFERRHHCRHCGHIFCNEHSPYQIPLDHNAEFHPEGAPSRACQHCWDRYRSWRVARTSRTNSMRSTVTATPGTPVPRMVGSGQVSEGHKGSVASSVPRDWNWSTF